jgi:hypothetical protein
LRIAPRAPKQGGLCSHCFGVVQNSFMKWRRFPALALLLLTFVFVTPFAHADTIVRGFNAKGALGPGLIVALSGKTTDTVVASKGNNPSKIYGVVIDPSQAPLTVQKKGEQVFVATGGTYPVLVSTQDGSIKTGDYISISSIDGIGSKAKEQPTVLGRAVENFDGKSNVITTTADGNKVGKINVSIIPGKNPLVKDNVAIPSILKRFGQAIAGRNISALRIYVSLVVFIVTSIIALTVLAVGVRSSITAIGRNPLSKKSILKGLLQVITVAFLVFLVGIVGVYLLLRL